MDVRCEFVGEQWRRDGSLLSACTTRPVVPSSLHLCGSAGVSGGVCGGPTGSMIVELSGSICGGAERRMGVQHRAEYTIYVAWAAPAAER